MGIGCLQGGQIGTEKYYRRSDFNGDEKEARGGSHSGMREISWVSGR